MENSNILTENEKEFITIYRNLNEINKLKLTVKMQDKLLKQKEAENIKNKTKRALNLNDEEFINYYLQLNDDNKNNAIIYVANLLANQK